METTNVTTPVRRKFIPKTGQCLWNNKDLRHLFSELKRKEIEAQNQRKSFFTQRSKKPIGG